MSQQTKEDRIKTLKATQQSRKEETLAKVNQAIERLQKTGAKINFQSIAREANVSVPYLYKYPELKERIMMLRSQQSQMPAHPVNKPPVTAKSHSQVVGRLKNRIHQLEAENKELKRKNEALAGQVYRVHSLQAQVERQQDIIATLEARLQDNPKGEVIPITSKSLNQRRDSIQDELDSLGIKLNSTLNKKIKANTEEAVLVAIEALKDQLSRGEVKNPGGWLARAIEEGWTKAESIPQEQPVTSPEIFKSSSEPEKELVSVDKLKALSNIFEEKDDQS